MLLVSTVCRRAPEAPDVPPDVGSGAAQAAHYLLHGGEERGQPSSAFACLASSLYARPGSGLQPRASVV
jgi:hypothetical protein